MCVYDIVTVNFSYCVHSYNSGTLFIECYMDTRRMLHGYEENTDHCVLVNQVEVICRLGRNLEGHLIEAVMY